MSLNLELSSRYSISCYGLQKGLKMLTHTMQMFFQFHVQVLGIHTYFKAPKICDPAELAHITYSIRQWRCPTVPA